MFCFTVKTAKITKLLPTAHVPTNFLQIIYFYFLFFLGLSSYTINYMFLKPKSYKSLLHFLYGYSFRFKFFFI